MCWWVSATCVGLGLALLGWSLCRIASRTVPGPPAGATLCALCRAELPHVSNVRREKE